MPNIIKVTIIIPTYNQERFIGDAISSALQQSYKNIEVIVGDDGSSDGTKEILKKFSDPRLRYVQNRINFGRTKNYKNLLELHATGDYVINLDGDDYFTDRFFVEEAVKLINNDRGVALVAARATTKSLTKEFVSSLPDRESISGIKILKNLPKSPYLFMHMAVLYNRHMALNLDFYRSPALSSDWESLYRLSLKGDVKYLDRNVGVWRLHQLNESTTKDPLRLFENLTIWSAIYGEAMMHGMSSIAAKYHSARCVAFFAQQSLVSLSKGSPQEFMIYFRQFIKTYKTSTIIMIFNPIYLMRLMLGFVGYYRYRNCKY